MFGSVDYDRLFFRWKTAALFGVATALSLVAILLRYTEINFSGLSRPALVGLSLLGAAVAFGGFSLLVGMWFFWVKCDASPRWQRGVWFVILLFGFFYGAVLYYLVVYLPEVKKALSSKRRGI
jgi:hypothetical protein